MSDQPSPLADYGLVVLLAAIFGMSFMLIKVAVAELPAALLVFVRVSVACALLLIMMRLLGIGFSGFSGRWYHVAASALLGNALPFYLISWGERGVDAGLAAILMAVMPLATITIAHFSTTDEKLNRYKLAGFLLGLAGVIVLIGAGKLTALGEQAVQQLAILLGAICYAVNAIVTKKLTGLQPYAMVTVLMGMSALMLLPFALPEFTQLSRLSLTGGLAVAALILLPTILGTLLLVEIVRRQGASFLSQINFLVPLAGVGWGMLLLGERLPVQAWLALAIIFAGIAIASIRPARGSAS
ncbi:MAG: DMT family transporter [Nitratireductor sp.]|nr:DMT family transporter [Nitratireductor sp.]